MHLCNMWMSFYTICRRSRNNRVILNIDIPLLIIFSKHTLIMPVLFLNMRIKSLALLKGLVYLVDCLGPHLGLRENCAPRFKSCLHCCQSILNFFYQKDQTNWSVLKSYQEKNKSHPFEVRHVIDFAQQANCGLFVASYAEFLSDGLQAQSGYVFNEDPQRPRPKKAKFDENVVKKKKAQGLAVKTNNVRKEDEENGKKGKQTSKQARTKQKRNSARGGGKIFYFSFWYSSLVASLQFWF
ncbi:hypothetical protein H5410_021312 [Solanum commersonii]|uniref:Ulp1 protease family, C-terminal catalytic domain containing protein n=1 Tax=Solanum commersonii TaxID=4109 RepID=A0A9J5ZDM0_SOLCO|nr:hypothetical protein H5410_021312 [Solanum commersonii]